MYPHKAATRTFGGAMLLIRHYPQNCRTARARSIVAAMITALLAAIMLVSGQAPAKAVGSFDNAVIADYALKNYPVGSYGGQCRTFVNNVVKGATGLNTGTGWPDYFVGFTNAGGVRITDVNALAKGDIVQYGQTEAYAGLHTFIIVSRVSGSTYNVIDSNRARDEKVSRYDRTVVLDNDRRAFRLGTVKTPVATTPPRIGSLSTDGTLYVKEGALDAPWVKESVGVKTGVLSGNRIGALTTDGTFYVKEGGLDAPWVKESVGVTSAALSGNRIGVVTSGTLYVKEGALDAPWVKESVGVSTGVLN